MATTILTYADCIDALADFTRMASTGVSLPVSSLKRAVVQAYNEVSAAADWSFLKRPVRITLREAQTTGTVVFDLASRALTLSDATWPSWVLDSAVLIGERLCEVESSSSSTVIVLRADACPVEDVASTTYELYPRWYLLPADFHSMHKPMEEESWRLGQQVTPEDMAALQKYEYGTTGSVRCFSIGPAEGIYGRMALSVWPRTDDTESLDLLCRHSPRELRHSGKEATDFVGTVSTTADSAAVTGSGTSFLSTMVGALLRTANTASDRNLPTGWDGAHPRNEEQSIATVTNGTSLTTNSALAATVAGVAYVVSDPVDLPVQMHNVLLRTAELHLARRLGIKNIAFYVRAARDAMRQAKASEGGLVRGREIAGVDARVPVRLADANSRPEVSS